MGTSIISAGEGGHEMIVARELRLLLFSAYHLHNNAQNEGKLIHVSHDAVQWQLSVGAPNGSESPSPAMLSFWLAH